MNALAEMGAEVRVGLAKTQKELPSKYLYDAVGTALFEVICLLPEYGVTRAEARLLRRHADEIVARLPRPVLVSELGSGSGKNTRWLLEALARRQPITYCPIDISRSALSRLELELADLRAVSVVGFEGLFLHGLVDVVDRRRATGERLLVLFLGGAIGNFDRPAGERFLAEVRGVLEPGDVLLLAADLVKAPADLLAAYDDSLGVTAAFNLNLLARLNRELDADFDLDRFAHEARWVEAERRTEMHLRARVAHDVHLRAIGLRVSFRKDETIWTENSHRFTVPELAQIGARAGFLCEAQWIDAEWPFAESLLVAR